MGTKGEVGQRSRQEDRGAYRGIVGEVGGQNVRQEGRGKDLDRRAVGRRWTEEKT